MATARPTGPFETRLLIGGERVAGTGPSLAVEDPATEQIVAEVAVAGADQLAEAVARAAVAQRSWNDVSGLERAELLHALATQMRGMTDELAGLMTLEGGKPLLENRDEVEWCAACFDYYAEIARDEVGRLIAPIEPTQLAMVVKEPIGVVACIVPWNYPLLLLCWKLAPALAAGNACVVKPSELTPLSTLALAPLFDALPPGTVSLLAGDGAVGEALVRDPGVAGIAFTGSVETGTAINRICAERTARVNLEMGGKDAFIVCADLSADEVLVAARGGAWAAYLNAGQVCTSAERFFVDERVWDPYLGDFAEHAAELVVGDPFDPRTDVGPMASAVQRDKVIAQLERAIDGGAELVTGGERGGHERGHYLTPAVVTDATTEAELWQTETFGPVAPLHAVGSLEVAITLANASPYGLGANVYTRDLANAMRCARELKAGTVWINDPLTDNDAGPFGGFKRSGLGRELGREGLDAFREAKHVHMETAIEIKDWWYPYGDKDA